MGFRNFFISIIKSLITLIIATLIFSTVVLDLPNLIKGLSRDVFSYSSPEAQKEVISKLTAVCSGLGEGNIDSLQQPANVPFDLKKIGSICKDYNSGSINDREFFFSVIGSAIPDKFELPKIGALEKYNSIIDTLNRNKIYYFFALAVLFALLYLLIMDVRLFIITLAGISFSIGILILLPYVAIIAYDKLVGIDTTPILSSLLQGGFSPDIKTIISVVLLMVLRTYTSLIIAIGIALFAIGAGGKLYKWKFSRKGAVAEAKKIKKRQQERNSRRK